MRAIRWMSPIVYVLYRPKLIPTENHLALCCQPTRPASFSLVANQRFADCSAINGKLFAVAGNQNADYAFDGTRLFYQFDALARSQIAGGLLIRRIVPVLVNTLTCQAAYISFVVGIVERS